MRFGKFTDHTIGSAEELRADLVKVHLRGYAIDDEEAVDGAGCVAAVILDGGRWVLGGISISGPTVRVGKVQVTEYATTLRTASAEIASRLKALSA
jgi:DNA-binding IclR family transcriptional regulator